MFSIKKGMKISTVQKLFNSGYPFLKLEFFRHPHGVHAGNDKKNLPRPGRSLEAPLKSQKDTDLLVTGDLTVAALEQLVMDHFGLSAQVFRKSGGSWLETTLTDDWTLQKQNDQGLELSTLHSLNNGI